MSKINNLIEGVQKKHDVDEYEVKLLMPLLSIDAIQQELNKLSLQINDIIVDYKKQRSDNIDNR